jgi:L-threonylcarbamoyladenylate synthase
MKTKVISADEPSAFTLALDVLRGNGIVAFPTDTVYGLGAMAFQPEGIDRLYEAKDRPRTLAIAVLLGTTGELEKVSFNPGQAANRLGERFWPGPLTLVVPRHPGVPDEIAQTPTIGVRIPDHPVALMLLGKTGPLAVTSANLSGEENAHTADEVLAQLGGRIDLVLDGGKTPGGVPSTVVNLTTDKPQILRPGPISKGEIRETLG